MARAPTLALYGRYVRARVDTGALEPSPTAKWLATAAFTTRLIAAATASSTGPSLPVPAGIHRNFWSRSLLHSSALVRCAARDRGAHEHNAIRTRSERKHLPYMAGALRSICSLCYCAKCPSSPAATTTTTDRPFATSCAGATFRIWQVLISARRLTTFHIRQVPPRRASAHLGAPARGRLRAPAFTHARAAARGVNIAVKCRVQITVNSTVKSFVSGVRPTFLIWQVFRLYATWMPAAIAEARVPAEKLIGSHLAAGAPLVQSAGLRLLHAGGDGRRLLSTAEMRSVLSLMVSAPHAESRAVAKSLAATTLASSGVLEGAPL